MIILFGERTLSPDAMGFPLVSSPPIILVRMSTERFFLSVESLLRSLMGTIYKDFSPVVFLLAASAFFFRDSLSVPFVRSFPPFLIGCCQKHRLFPRLPPSVCGPLPLCPTRGVCPHAPLSGLDTGKSSPELSAYRSVLAPLFSTINATPRSFLRLLSSLHFSSQPSHLSSV